MKLLYEPGDRISWVNVDDPVMGGLSNSKNALHKGFLRFSGTVSLQNNGGFCSMRSEGKTWDLSGFGKLVVVAKGDGKRLKVTLRTDWNDSGAYQLGFSSRDEMATHTFLLREFEYFRRGNHIKDAPALDVSKICSVGFLIAEKQVGDFEFDIFQIRSE
jgi:monofunctional biosynthetic peptidoglycan transglycosylase